MDLFGRKERIKELEEQLASQEKELTGKIEKLQNRLEKEQERSRKASAAKQDAEEKVNRLEDKIKSLQDRIGDEGEGMTFEQDYHDLDLVQTTELIDNVDRLSYRSSRATTVYSRPEETITGSDTGEVILSGPHMIGHAIQPPLPVQEGEAYRSDGFITEGLRTMIEDRYCLLHMTAGGSGIAVIEDGDVVESTVIDADIKAKHTKGGYSQKRFERRREEQIEEHLEAVIDAAAPLLDAGYRTLFLAGGTDLTDQASKMLDQETSPFSSQVSRIEDKKDMKRSFRTGFRFRLQRLTDNQIESAMERL